MTIRATLVLLAGLSMLACAPKMTTVRTVSGAEYAGSSWIGHPAEDVYKAWGPNEGEADGSGGRVLVYRRVGAAAYPTSPSNDPFHTQALNETVRTEELAKFWIGDDGKVSRYWLADEVYKRHLDSPTSRPVDVYGSRTGN